MDIEPGQIWKLKKSIGVEEGLFLVSRSHSTRGPDVLFLAYLGDEPRTWNYPAFHNASQEDMKSGMFYNMEQWEYVGMFSDVFEMENV